MARLAREEFDVAERIRPPHHQRHLVLRLWWYPYSAREVPLHSYVGYARLLVSYGCLRWPVYRLGYRYPFLGFDPW